MTEWTRTNTGTVSVTLEPLSEADPMELGEGRFSGRLVAGRCTVTPP
jgi:hypothetical protein